MEQYTVRGIGRTQSLSDLEQVVVLSRAGTPVLLRDVANVTLKPMQRQGATTRGGEGETVSGMAIMLKGENGMRVIERVRAKIASLRLPRGAHPALLRPKHGDQQHVVHGSHGVAGRRAAGGAGIAFCSLGISAPRWW